MIIIENNWSYLGQLGSYFFPSEDPHAQIADFALFKYTKTKGYQPLLFGIVYSHSEPVTCYFFKMKIDKKKQCPFSIVGTSHLMAQIEGSIQPLLASKDKPLPQLRRRGLNTSGSSYLC